MSHLTRCRLGWGLPPYQLNSPNITKNQLHGHQSVILLQNTFETTSSFTNAWHQTDFPPRLAAHQISNSYKHSFLVFRQTTDGPHLPVFQYTAAVDFIQQPSQAGSVQYAEIPAAVVKSEIRLVVDFLQVAPLCVKNFMRLLLTDVFKIKWHWSVPNVTQIDSGNLKMWTVTHRGLT